MASDEQPGFDLQDLTRFRLPPGFRGRSAATVQLWWIAQALLVHPSPQIFYGWRRAILRLFGARLGQGVRIRPSVRVTYPWRLEIGDHSWIGDGVELYTLGSIRIGRSAVVSQGSYLCGGTHDHRDPTFPMRTGPITIGDEAWLAAQVFVAPGVTVGRGAVVGARSLVLEDVPGGAVAVGHPARVTGAPRAESRAAAPEKAPAVTADTRGAATP